MALHPDTETAPFAPPAVAAPYKSSGVQELCERHGISLSFGYKLIAMGKLRATKIGRRTVIREVDEAAWLASLSSAPEKPKPKARPHKASAQRAASAA